MFKIKITVIGALGDPVKFPCHACQKIGDEIIFDGEQFIGKICPAVWVQIVNKVNEMILPGPRHVEPLFYAPFLYAPLSARDENMKKYDGKGFRNVFDKWNEAKNPGAYSWPPAPRGTIFNQTTVICPDNRTSMVYKLEAFDLADTSVALPFFRREMVILYKVLPKPGISIDKILNEFSKDEIEIPYPALSQSLLEVLVEELQIMGYLEIKEGKASVTNKGKEKLQKFKDSLKPEEKEALNII